MNQKTRERRERKYREEFKPAYDEWIKLYPFDTTDLPGETWLPIPDYEGLYHESNYGRTKSFHNGIVKILTPHINRQGYLYVHLYKDGTQKHFLVARLVAELFIPNPEGKPQVNHLHGRFNNHVDNLEWATSAENIQHAWATGLTENAKGCDDSQSLFNDEAKIIYIRNNPDGLTQEQLADMFNCKQQTVSEIQLGKRYVNCGGVIREPQKHKSPRHLTPEERELVRKLYVPYSREFGAPALARMFNCCKATIWEIVNAD